MPARAQNKTEHSVCLYISGCRIPYSGLSDFGCLFLRALKNTSQNLSLLKILTITIFFCILYAISDEFHQAFVPGRYASSLDVLMDGVGSVLAVGLNPFSGVAVGQDKGI